MGLMTIAVENGLMTIVLPNGLMTIDQPHGLRVRACARAWARGPMSRGRHR
jgi:proline racemase